MTGCVHRGQSLARRVAAIVSVLFCGANSASAQNAWVGRGSWSDPMAWMLSTVPNSSTASVIFSTKGDDANPFHLGGGPYMLRNLTVENATNIGWIFNGGGLVFAPGATLSFSTHSPTLPNLDNGYFELSGPTTLRVALGSTFRLSNSASLTGTGTLVLEGGGTAILGGANTFDGVTTINATTLQVGDGGTSGSLGPGAIVNNGVLRLLRSDNLLMSQDISGAGSLEKRGGGTLTLAGTNSYSGATTISQGVLQIGAGGTTGSLGRSSIFIAASGALAVNRSDAMTLANTITGPGALNQIGTGTTTLAGNASAFTGTTNVNAGTLQVTGSLGGGSIFIAASGALAVNRSDAMTLANTITGTGALNQIGTGTTTLSGNAGSFAGTTNVAAGALLVTGSLGGVVNVNAGGLLGGTGTVGSTGATTRINAGGTLAPGLSPGTLTIAGNLALAAGSISNFELNTSLVVGGVNDLIVVGGDLSIANGAILNVGPAVSGQYRLFNVGGAVIPGGGSNLGFTTINAGPGVTSAFVQSLAATPNQVNLFLSNGGQMVQAFDGTDLTGASPGGQGGNGTWGVSSNWAQNPNGVLNDPWLNQVGVFGGANGGSVTVLGSQGFQGLQFTANGYALSGGAINALGNAVPGGNAQASFLNVDPGASTTIASTISSGAGIGLDKLGGGTLVLTGANSFSGLTDVQNGVLNVRNGAALGVGDGSAATGTRVRGGASLAIEGGVAVSGEALFLNGLGVGGGGALRSLSGVNAWNGGVTLEASSRISVDAGSLTIGGAIGGTGTDLSIGGPGNVTIAGPIGIGPGTLTFDGSGTLTLAGMNSFTGPARSLAGTLRNNGRLSGGVSNGSVFINAGSVGGRLVNAGTAENLTGGVIGGGVDNSGLFVSGGTIDGGVTNAGVVRAAGRLNGAVLNSSTGSFSTTGLLSGHIAVFDSAGSVSIDGGDLGGVGTFVNSGWLAATGGGARALGAAAFVNAATGVVTQSNGVTSDVLSFGGSYAGASGSRILQDVDLSNPAGGAGRGDRILVAGDATGATTFVFAPTSAGRSALRAPIPVFATGGSNNLAANEGLIPNLGSGFIDYFLRRSASGNGFEIASRFNSGPAAGVAGAVGGILSSLQSTIHQPVSTIPSRNERCRDGRSSGGPFIRMMAGETRTRSASSTFGDGPTALTDTRSGIGFKGFQTGFDAGFCDVGYAGWSLNVGATGGVVEMSATAVSRSPTPFSGLATAARTQASARVPFAGVYGYVSNGAFTGELSLRRDFFDIAFSSTDAVHGAPLIGPNQNQKIGAWSLSGMLSYRFALGNGLFLEPQISLSRARASFAPLNAAGGGSDIIRLAGAGSLMGRMGLRASTALMPLERFVIVPYVNASLWREFSRHLSADVVNGASGQAIAVRTDRVGSFGQLGAGVELRSSDTRLSAFVQAEAPFGDRLTGKTVNAGLTMRF